MNTFGAYNQQFALYDPRSVRENRERFGRDSIELLKRANSFYCPVGRWPCRGWILMARKDFNKLNKYSTELQLNIGDTRKTDNVGTIKLLSIVQAQCVTRGIASDENALYLVEITDGRGILHNDWFQFPTTSAYNIRSPAYPQTFQLESMNDYPTAGAGSKTTWTWTTMLRNLWEQMSTFLGAWPGLPSTPNSTPEGFWFPGVSAWTALCDILDHLGMAVACNPTKGSPYTIVVQDAADSAFTALETKYTKNLQDDLEWIDTGAARVPKTIKVLFRRRNSIYGTEETVTYRNDIMAKQWDMAAFYSVTVTAPSTYASAVGTHLIWSDFTVRYSDSSDPLDEDITVANRLAAELVVQYFNRITGYMAKTYCGALPFTTGSQVEGVCWSQDYSNQDRQEWKTQIIRRGGRSPWPEIYGE